MAMYRLFRGQPGKIERDRAEEVPQVGGGGNRYEISARAAF